MKIKNLLVGLVLLGAVGSMGYLGYRYLVFPHQQCDICGREVHTAHQATVVLRGQSPKLACCPRCALHYEHHWPGQVVRMLVADRSTGMEIEADRAVYVEGSDDMSCRPASESVPREPGVEYDLKFDRCLPSLVAFKEEAEARAFQTSHGGRLLTYAQALESVKQR